jgi:hypothetical protein
MAHVSYQDLDEILREYYAGRLDDCDRFLDRICGDLRSLHPTNTLFGLCDNEFICSCVESLQKVYQWVLYFLKSPFSDDESYLIVSNYFNESGTGNFQAWISEKQAIAMETIAKLVLEQI